MFQATSLTVGFLLLLASLAVPALVLLVNPLILLIRARTSPRPVRRDPGFKPAATILCIFHDAAGLVAEKARNLLELDYPPELLEILFYEDGGTEQAREMLKPYLSDRFRYMASLQHVGKNVCLNAAVEAARGEVLVVSDAGARLPRNALSETVACFADPDVGGVSGRLVLSATGRGFEAAQQSYLDIDAVIRRLESTAGSLTSNRGSLTAVRRECWQPVPASATDDLFMCLSVVRRKRRFVYEPRALAFVTARSRDSRHELSRRRRIVTRSLRGIWSQRALLNPGVYGVYSLHLLLNKVLRRFLPLAGILFVAATLLLVPVSRFFAALLCLQIAGLCVALLCPVLHRADRLPRILRKVTGLAWYSLLGGWGTLLGLYDLARGESAEKWKPRS